MSSSDRSRGGFSIIEVLVALMILTLGMLAMASAYGYASLEVRMSVARTQRTAAVGSVIEQIRARAPTGGRWQSLTSVPQGSAITIGAYQVWYTVGAPTGANSARRDITIFSQGPSYVRAGGWKPNVQEQYTYSLVQPIP